ncbi:MAG: DUF1611 domain-containing protein [Candidatus Marinimicrobia bacterium]|nr:DUF1611 domain-containing protein [Candidatus Neomarinimicrobiota bacterium]MCF7905346.1 DUF1611 domain-containing protein [Candidatus Neomarinimicrobiota bacterium]
MLARALVYCENEFGQIDGKVANGLARHSEKYDILGIIDSTKAGLDSGEYLDGINNGVPIFSSIENAIDTLSYVPEYFIYGIAAQAAFLDQEQRELILSAMKTGMNFVNGLPEFFTDDDEFIRKAIEYQVQIYDLRKSPPRKNLHNFSGRIHDVKTPVLAVLGTDCAVGKRTTAVKLIEALKLAGLNAVFIATGQTGLLQGAKYGLAVDVLTSGFATGEIEYAILKADRQEQPDIIIVEGQGALSHPAYGSTSAILRGAVPGAVILQHPPKRVKHADYPELPMTTLAYEIELMELFSDTKVIALTINHEDMTDTELIDTIEAYEATFQRPTTDVLKYGCDKLVEAILTAFPELQKRVATK